MARAQRPQSLVRFEDLELDLRAGELRSSDGKTVRLTEQPLQILTLLLQSPGEVVLREEIRNRLWPNDTIVEFEHSINAAMKRLRQALGESAEHPRYIETLARRGYRWKVSVQWVEVQRDNAGPAEPEVPPASPIAFEGPLIGKKVSHYRVLSVLGGGGMGVVYKAEDLKLGRRVALKFLPEEVASDRAARQRFESEARSASALNHPNICTIYGVEEYEGQPFLAMELLEGQTLRDVIATMGPGRPALELPKLLDLAMQIASGLEAAHCQGIIHRDIKPANIFITNQGQAKILDFGLAKLFLIEADSPATDPPEQGSPHELGHETDSLTASSPFLSRTGVAMGTAGYMSPEQIRGEKLDARTDLFSFGLVLYEMTTGRRAFRGDTAPVLHDAILKQVPNPMRELSPELPAKFDEIILKALEKDREKRYQSAADLRADLQALRRSVESMSASRRWIPAPVAALVLLIAGGIFWYEKHQPSSTQALPQIKFQQLTINSSENPVTFGAISPDGKYLAYTDAKGMHIKLVGTDETQLVPQPAGLTNDKVKWEILAGSWFPDSKTFFANAHPPDQIGWAWTSETSSIWSVSVMGGPPHKIRDHAIAWAVSPDGSAISFGTNWGTLDTRELWLMRPDGGEAHMVDEVDDKHGICCLHFFPNGQRVAYLSTDESGASLVARDLKGGPVVMLMPSSEVKKIGPDFSFLPDGRLIYSDPCNGLGAGAFDFPCNYWIKRFDIRTGEVVEKPRRLTNWTGFSLDDLSASADGKRVAFLESSNRGLSYLFDLEAGGTRLVNSRRFTTEEGGDDFISDWTSDGKTVILGQNRNGHYSLRKQLLNSDTQDTIVSTAAGAIEDAVMSPDGKWVITAVYPGPSMPQPLMRVPINGGSPELIFLRSASGPGFFCARRPSNLCALVEQSEDHKQMVVTAFDPIKGRGAELARFDLDPDFKQNIDRLLCNISLDGTRLVASRGPRGPLQIRYLRSGRTQTIPTKSLKRMQAVVWTADGNGLFVSNLTNEGSETVHVDLLGNTKVLWHSNSVASFARPSPDGRHLAIYESRQGANMWMMENF